MSPARALLSLLLFCAACGSHGGSYALDVGGDDAGSLTLSALEGGVQSLDAHVESKGVAVTVVTLSCSGSCAVVQAVGTGGYPPYTYRWSDGVTTSTRSLCPSSTARYSVAVTDTGRTSEVVRPPQTAQATVTADVIACPDAGIGRDAGLGDAGSGSLCIMNPSFEGTAAIDLFDNFDAPPWSTCSINGADLVNPTVGAGVNVSFPAPTDGNAYVNLVGNRGDGDESVSSPLCATLRAGLTYSLQLDVISPSEGSFGGEPPATLEIWGATSARSSCSDPSGTDLLWTSPTAGPTWGTYCATLTPPHDATQLTFIARTGPIGIDHIVPVANCP